MKQKHRIESRAPRTPDGESGWAAWRRACDSAPPDPPFKRPAPAAVADTGDGPAPFAYATRVFRPGQRAFSLVVEKCPHCGERHYHGVVGPRLGDGDGLRLADCWLGSYRVVEVGVVILADGADARERMSLEAKR